MPKHNDIARVEWLYREVGARLKAVRLEQGLTQLQLAKSAELDRTSVAKIEAGKQRFTLDTFYSLLGALGAAAERVLPDLEDFADGGPQHISILENACAPEGVGEKEIKSILSAITKNEK